MMWRRLLALELKADTRIFLVQVVAVDPGQRGVSEGVQVMAGAPFLLQHCATKQVCTSTAFSLHEL
jgi:hypothetical protein